MKPTKSPEQVDALKKAVNYSEELLIYGMANYLEVLISKMML
jgi:hypothetical protein